MDGRSSNPKNVDVYQTCMTVVTADTCPDQGQRREPLSNFDLLMPKQDVDVILCYEKPNVGFDLMVATLKRSLAKTLVEYYVFAGELVCKDSSGELEILCNNRGVDFIEACVDIALRELEIYKPDDVIVSKIAPEPKEGGSNLVVKVTLFLRCGSIVVACKFDHRVADGYAANMFLVSWSENAALKPLSSHPSRLIFNPRSPLKHSPEMEKIYCPASSLPPSFIQDEVESSINRIYHITADQIIALQEAVSTETSKRTKLESFSAFLWQLLAKSASQEKSVKQKSGEELITKMTITVDGRSRLESAYGSQSCINYFGNVISITTGSETLEKISQKPLTWIGERVAQVIKAGANEDHFLDLIDLVETFRPEKLFMINFWPQSMDGPTVSVSSGLRFPFGNMDFGWGKPLLGFFCFTWELEVGIGYVMPITIPAGNGDWLVYVHLPKSQIEFIENEASNVFKPLMLDQVPRST